MSAPETLARLESAELRLRAAFASPAACLHTPYGPGKWNGLQLLLHLADSLPVQLDRVRRIISEERPLLLAFSQDAWVERQCTGARDLSVAGALALASLAAIRELAQAHLESEGERVGIHTERGLVTLSQILAGVASHTAHHLDQLDQAVAGSGVAGS